MNEVMARRQRQRDPGVRRIVVRIRADDVERVRSLAMLLFRGDEPAARLRRQVDLALADNSDVEVSALEALRMPEDDVIADTIDQVVRERPLARVRDIEW